MKKRIVLIIFVAVQIAGLACSWFWHHPYSSASSLLWGSGFLVLLPGNVLGSWLVEKLFWESHLSPLVTELLTVVAVVAINAIVWFVVVKTLRFIYGRLFTHSDVKPVSNNRICSSLPPYDKNPSARSAKP